MFSMLSSAKEGDFIKDLGAQKRSLGLVTSIDKKTNMMRVKFPKVGKDQWVMWKNYGHYKVV
jgi:hypothetical protein|tara:strand:- start:1010 stop:1195 length:186 start_codon:yes stop_codon:yes gene_type:complete